MLITDFWNGDWQDWTTSHAIYVVLLSLDNASRGFHDEIKYERTPTFVSLSG